MAREDEDVEWISVREAAEILGVPLRTAYHSLKDPDLRAQKWGERGDGWRPRRLSSKPNSYEIRKSWAKRLASES